MSTPVATVVSYVAMTARPPQDEHLNAQPHYGVCELRLRPRCVCVSVGWVVVVQFLLFRTSPTTPPVDTHYLHCLILQLQPLWRHTNRSAV